MRVKNILSRLLPQFGKSFTYEKGHTLFHIGDDISHLFEVQTGVVKLFRIDEFGHKLTLQMAKKGDILGEASLFSDNYHCDAEVIEPTTLLAFSKSHIINEFKENPQSALIYMQMLSQQIMALRNKLEQRNIHSAKERLLSYFYSMAKDNASNQFSLPFSLKELADELGLQQETLYRTIATLVKNGLILRDKNRITLLKYDLNHI